MVKNRSSIKYGWTITNWPCCRLWEALRGNESQKRDTSVSNTPLVLVRQLCLRVHVSCTWSWFPGAISAMSCDDRAAHWSAGLKETDLDYILTPTVPRFVVVLLLWLRSSASGCDCTSLAWTCIPENKRIFKWLVRRQSCDLGYTDIRSGIVWLCVAV